MFERYSYRSKTLIFIALWSARRRGALYIEPEDLLHALIREDRGEIGAIGPEVFPGATSSIEFPARDHHSFFSDDVARSLLRELNEDPDPLRSDTATPKREPVPHADMPLSTSLKEVLVSAADLDPDHKKTIEPLHLLAGLVKNSGSRLAQLLQKSGITRNLSVKIFTQSENY